jgi:threonine synthase
MISCQSTGCAPIARAFDEGARFAQPFENAGTVASGIRVPAAVGDFMILEAVRASGGLAVAAPEEDIPRWMELANAKEGIAICPETAICLGALEMLLKSGQISPSERILVFNTGAGQKYPEVVEEKLERIDISKPIDWDQILLS